MWAVTFEVLAAGHKTCGWVGSELARLGQPSQFEGSNCDFVRNSQNRDEADESAHRRRRFARQLYRGA